MKAIVHRRDGTPVPDGEGGRSREGTVDIVASILKTSHKEPDGFGRSRCRLSWVPLVDPSHDELLRIARGCGAAVVWFNKPQRMIEVVFHVKHGGSTLWADGWARGGYPKGVPIDLNQERTCGSLDLGDGRIMSWDVAAGPCRTVYAHRAPDGTIHVDRSEQGPAATSRMNPRRSWAFRCGLFMVAR